MEKGPFKMKGFSGFGNESPVKNHERPAGTFDNPGGSGWHWYGDLPTGGNDHDDHDDHGNSGSSNGKKRFFRNINVDQNNFLESDSGIRNVDPNPNVIGRRAALPNWMRPFSGLGM